MSWLDIITRVTHSLSQWPAFFEKIRYLAFAEGAHSLRVAVMSQQRQDIVGKHIGIGIGPRMKPRGKRCQELGRNWRKTRVCVPTGKTNVFSSRLTIHRFRSAECSSGKSMVAAKTTEIFHSTTIADSNRKRRLKRDLGEICSPSHGVWTRKSQKLLNYCRSITYVPDCKVIGEDWQMDPVAIGPCRVGRDWK